MCMTLRPTDMQGERIVKQFLISNFYERIRNNGILPNIINYESIDDINRQIQGIDTILYEANGTQLIIDEKCALKYINTGLSTFAFEILWKRQNTLTDGWFINADLQTQFYFTMWISGREKRDERTRKVLTGYDYIRNMCVDDLTHIELYVLSKQRLHRYLDNIGLTIKALQDRAISMIENNREQLQINDDIKFYYSSYLAEKPVNLVINKSLLRTMASVFDISPYQVKRNGTIIFETP